MPWRFQREMPRGYNLRNGMTIGTDRVLLAERLVCHIAAELGIDQLEEVWVQDCAFAWTSFWNQLRYNTFKIAEHKSLVMARGLVVGKASSDDVLWCSALYA